MYRFTNTSKEAMRIFKTKVFNKWAKGLLLDNSLLVAAHEIAAGDFDASLGQKVYKKRIAVAGKGKSGGARTIVAYQEGNNLFFMYGFEKNEKSNITNTEKKALQELAKVYFALSNKQLNKEVKDNRLIEVKRQSNKPRG